MTDLVSAIEAATSRLTARVLDEMYRDPFWMSRYGARGRQHAEADSRYHVTYLAEALRNQDARILTRYASWLRSVLVSRGMCSAHLSENFERLSRALADEIEGAEPAIALLQQAAEGLRYQEGVAGFLDAQRAALVEATLAEMARRTEPVAERESDLSMRLPQRLALTLSYLADGLQLDRLELFLDYLRWYRDFLFAQRDSSEPLQIALRTLQEVLARQPELSGPPRAALANALQDGVSTLSQSPTVASAL